MIVRILRILYNKGIIVYVTRVVRPIHIMKRISTILLISAVLASASQAERTLEGLRKTFKDGIARIDADTESRKGTIQSQYMDALQGLQGRMKQAGDLDGLLAAQTEHKRFEEALGVSENDLSTTPDVFKLQSSYQKEVGRLPAERAAKVVTLSEQYARSLDSLQAGLTRTDKIAEAIAVKKERESISTMPVVTEARFILAEANAATPEPEKPTEQVAVVKPEPEPEPDPVDEVKRPSYTGSTDNYVRKRYQSMTRHLEKRDVEGALDYISPSILEEWGANIVRTQLNIMSQVVYAPIAANPKFDHGITSVRVNEDKTAATIIPKAKYGVQWKDLTPLNWVLEDGDWYLRPGNQNANSKQVDRAMRKRKKDQRRNRL